MGEASQGRAAVASFSAAARRDRWIVISCLLGVTALAWLYLAHLDPRAVPTWRVSDFGLMFLMWAVMMLGMMLPGASPMVSMFVRLNGHREFAATGAFVFGYLAVWTGFSLVAAFSQWGLQGAGLLSPTMTGTSSAFAGLVLLGAGVYQWTPLKHACLRHCQTPLGFLISRWRDGTGGAFRMGLSHGTYCVGCCWALMALLFVGGVMNLLWVALLAALVLLEKLTPSAPWLPRFLGTGFAAWGGWILITAP